MATLGAGALSAFPYKILAQANKKTYPISLAQFSFASDYFAGKADTLDFPALAKNTFDIDIVEYVSMFFADKANDAQFFKDLKQRADDVGVTNNLIMVDDENIADLDKTKRMHAVESHYKWVDAAKVLGCASIRVNLGAIGQEGTPDQLTDAALDGYAKLLEYGTQNDMNIIVENHVGISSNGAWLANIMKEINNPRAGTLPDFGNFCVQRTMPKTMDIEGYMNTTCVQAYDTYKGMEELMPYAKGVSAKAHKFDADGNEPEIDFDRIFRIIEKSGFDGIVGIEYEGGLMASYGQEGYLDNEEGVKAIQALVEKVM